MLPASGCRMFISMRMVVVLPVPFGPISANTEPSGTLRFRSSMASTLPKRFCSPCVSMIIGYHLQGLQFTPLFFDGHEHVRQGRADAHRFDDELLDVVAQQAFAIAGARLR